MYTPYSYGVWLAMWNYTVLPSTRHKWSHPAFTPARQAGTWLPTLEGWKAELTEMVGYVVPRWFTCLQSVSRPSRNRTRFRATSLIQMNSRNLLPISGCLSCKSDTATRFRRWLEYCTELASDWNDDFWVFADICLLFISCYCRGNWQVTLRSCDMCSITTIQLPLPFLLPFTYLYLVSK